MQFTYEAYRKLIRELIAHGYNITDYHHYDEVERPCILRHDIDQSPLRAVKLAEVEKSLGITSTYFVLLTSDFYNVFSAENRDALLHIADMGHTIGLHFDEVAYPELDAQCEGADVAKVSLVKKIISEAKSLSDALDMKIDTVSMHRPSTFCLENDLQIPGMINSYGQEFFNNFKYLSDSRHRWREDAMKYIREETYPRLHILTHAFWYHEQDLNLQDTLLKYLDHAKEDRYKVLSNNFTRLDDALAGRG